MNFLIGIYDEIVANQFWAGVTSAFAFWLVSSGGLHLYKRRQARLLLLHEVNETLVDFRVAIRDLHRLIQVDITVGQPLNQSGRYTPNKCLFFDALQSEVLSLFPYDGRRIFATYHMIEVVNCLIENLYSELSGEANKRNLLTANDQAYYVGKLIRIMSLVDKFGEGRFSEFSTELSSTNLDVSVEELRELIVQCRVPRQGKGKSA